MAQHRQLHTIQSTRCLLSPSKEALDANVSSQRPLNPLNHKFIAVRRASDNVNKMNKAKGISILNVCVLTILIDTLQIKHSFCLYIIYFYIYICLAKCTLEEALDANVSRPTLSHGMFSCSLQSLLATIEAQTAASTRIYGADSDVVKIE